MTWSDHNAGADCPDHAECDFVFHTVGDGPRIGEVCGCCGETVKPTEEELLWINAANDRPDPKKLTPDLVRQGREAAREAWTRAGLPPLTTDQPSPTEERVAVPIELWDELEWLEDGPLTEAMAAAADGGYAEGGEEGREYVFYCHGLDLPALQLLVAGLVGDRYAVTIEEAPDHADNLQQARVTKVVAPV